MYFNKIQWYSDAKPQFLGILTRDGYRTHQLIWSLFSHATRRQFLYRKVEREPLPTFYVVSKERPLDKAGHWNIQSKPYDPLLRAGQELGFSLIANPVVTRRDPESGRTKRHDIVADGKKQSPDGNTRDIQQDSGYQWLASRAAKNGFKVCNLSVDGYRQHRLRSHRSQSPIHFSTLEFQGIIQVTDSDKLRHTLFHGIGPAKAFGCGLLLVRRV